MNMFKPSAAKTVKDYIQAIDEPRKSDIEALHRMLLDLTGAKPSLVYSMIGYGMFHYKSKSGREGDWPLVALASQKNYISVYLCAVDENGRYIPENYKAEFPKASIGKSCIRFKRLSDIDTDILRQAVRQTLAHKPAV